MTQEPSEICSFPGELLTAIFENLDYEDVISVRKTCRTFRDISRTRSIWLNLLERYIHTVDPRPLWPDKPTTSYSTDELEYMIFRWKTVKIGRTSKTGLPRRRKFSTFELRNYRVHLVKGGRWFLTATRNGTINYYDLDAKDITGRTLVPTLLGSNTSAITFISVDMHLTSSCLSFNLGIVTFERDAHLPNAWFQVWHVSAAFDKEGDVVGLVAHRLSSFQEESEVGCYSFNLSGKYLAYSSWGATPEDSIVVVNWAKAKETTSLNYSRIIIPAERADWLVLLPDTRLLCLDKRAAQWSLFDFANAPTAALPLSRIKFSRIKPLAVLDLQTFSISQPFTCQDWTRVAVLTKQGVVGITVFNAVESRSQVITRILNSDLNRRMLLGYNHAICMDSYPYVAIQYAWSKEALEPEASDAYSTFTDEGIEKFPRLLCLDENSGRLMSFAGSDECYLLEFSP